MNPLVEELLLRSVVIFLLLGSIAGMVAGVLLLWRPDRLRGISAFLNRWISTRHLDSSLERSISVDPWFYRYRRSSATLILLAAVYIVYFFTVSLDRANAVAGIARRFALPSAAAGGLLDALVLSALLGALLAAFVSLFLLLRPSLLRDFEQAANQWISLRRALRPMEIPRQGVDEYVFRHGRRVGSLLIVGSLYVMVLLTTWIGR